MADFIFDVALGKHVYYAELPGSTDSLIVVPVNAGAASDSSIRVAEDLGELLGIVTEQTTLGRKTLSGVSVGVANNIATVDAADVVWEGTSGNDLTDLVVCYKPDSSSTDDAIIPLYCLDFEVAIDGSDVTAVINTDGLATAANGS